jgi:hypothetical protein
MTGVQKAEGLIFNHGIPDQVRDDKKGNKPDGLKVCYIFKIFLVFV